MKDKLQNIILLFADSCPSIELHETWDEFSFEVVVTLSRVPSLKDLSVALPEISPRDNWRLLIVVSGESILDLYSDVGDLADIYNVDEIEAYQDIEVKITYSITKIIKERVISVYSSLVFTEYLGQSNLSAFLNAINKLFSDSLTVEVWDDNFQRLNSSTIGFVKKDDDFHPSKIEYRNSRIASQRKFCQIDALKWNLLPEDLLMNGANNELLKIFKKAELALSLLSICDNTKIADNNYAYRLCGYKSLMKSVDATRLVDLDLDEIYCQSWFEIYDWVYTGGYTSDRLIIARNIISLNCDESIIAINESTLRSIKSNFKIFEQDNVRQYIKVRNEISSMLINMQKDVNGIVDGFVSDFKKNIMTTFSFFLTVVVVRVIAKGDFTGGFTWPIFMLSMIFLILSCVFLYYSRMELESKEKLFTKHYKQIEGRYKSLLSEDELKEMFDDCDPNKLDSHANYIEWKKNIYTGLWVVCIVLLTLFVLFAWGYNCVNSESNNYPIKLIIECCTKNM